MDDFEVRAYELANALEDAMNSLHYIRNGIEDIRTNPLDKIVGQLNDLYVVADSAAYEAKQVL